MTEEKLSAHWAVLEPTARQRRRIERRVFDWLEARESSLAAEWLGMIRLHPIAGLALAAGSALALVILTPLGWLASTMLL